MMKRIPLVAVFLAALVVMGQSPGGLGISLVTDAYRVPQQRVLNLGDMYLLTSPEFLGAYTDRGPVVANEVNASSAGHGVPARGWHLFETMSMTVPNSRGLVYANAAN